MPKSLSKDGSQALTNAERQARHRARKADQTGTTIRYCRPADPSVGTTPWPSCSPCRSNTPPGQTPCRTRCATLPRPRRSRPLSTSNYPTLPISSRPADTVATKP